VLSAKKENTLIAEDGIQARTHSLVRWALVQLTLKHGLLVSAALAGIASAAVYVLAFLLFTIHEEIGIPPDAALHVAQWTFPVAFLASFVGYWHWKTGSRRR
jgi:hypothetical protein